MKKRTRALKAFLLASTQFNFSMPNFLIVVVLLVIGVALIKMVA